MNTMQIRDAKANFSAVVATAQQGHPTVITRHGLPVAMVISIVDGERLYPRDIPSLATHLLALPEGLPAEHVGAPLRHQAP